jgi:hypothetical protein
LTTAVNSQQCEGILSTTRCLQIVDKVILSYKIFVVSVTMNKPIKLNILEEGRLSHDYSLMGTVKYLL